MFLLVHPHFRHGKRQATVLHEGSEVLGLLSLELIFAFEAWGHVVLGCSNWEVGGNLITAILIYFDFRPELLHRVRSCVFCFLLLQDQLARGFRLRLGIGVLWVKAGVFLGVNVDYFLKVIFLRRINETLCYNEGRLEFWDWGICTDILLFWDFRLWGDLQIFVDFSLCRRGGKLSKDG